MLGKTKSSSVKKSNRKALSEKVAFRLQLECQKGNNLIKIRRKSSPGRGNTQFK